VYEAVLTVLGKKPVPAQIALSVPEDANTAEPDCNELVVGVEPSVVMYGAVPADEQEIVAVIALFEVVLPGAMVGARAVGVGGGGGGGGGGGVTSGAVKLALIETPE
jgi:hypothetical protein